jgi:integrase
MRLGRTDSQSRVQGLLEKMDLHELEKLSTSMGLNTMRNSLEFDAETKEFLEALSPSTRNVYEAGLHSFQVFYKGPPGRFLDAVEQDLRMPRAQRQRVARNTIKLFVKWLQSQGLASKTIRAYVSAVQSLGSYYDTKITTKFTNIPASVPVSSKFPWTLDSFVKFVSLFGDPEMKSIAVDVFQSGLGISDILALNHGDIKYEYEHDVLPLCFDLYRIKTKVPHLTFIGRWGVHLLKGQLKGRRLDLETPLYRVGIRMVDEYFQGIAEKFVGEYRGRNPCRVHTLRAAFRTILGDTGQDRDVVKFFMGQRLPEQDRVYHSRTREGWRSLYAKTEEALTPNEWRKI